MTVERCACAAAAWQRRDGLAGPICASVLIWGRRDCWALLSAASYLATGLKYAQRPVAATVRTRTPLIFTGIH